MNECKLRCPNMIGAYHTRFYRGSNRSQAVTIERLSLSIPSHTEKDVKWQGKGKDHEAPAEREGLLCRMPMGAGFFEKARADSET
uniref:Uncharacterized protein n=1 Tax=Solanum lycopersicum TaxID=4081 RepID=K4CD64_SOLLC